MILLDVLEWYDRYRYTVLSWFDTAILDIHFDTVPLIYPRDTDTIQYLHTPVNPSSCFDISPHSLLALPIEVLLANPTDQLVCYWHPPAWLTINTLIPQQCHEDVWRGTTGASSVLLLSLAALARLRRRYQLTHPVLLIDALLLLSLSLLHYYRLLAAQVLTNAPDEQPTYDTNPMSLCY